jgi:hypothetical protein
VMEGLGNHLNFDHLWTYGICTIFGGEQKCKKIIRVQNGKHLCSAIRLVVKIDNLWFHDWGRKHVE